MSIANNYHKSQRATKIVCKVAIASRPCILLWRPSTIESRYIEGDRSVLKRAK